jgi:superfamily II DNA or RNA helicase
MSKKKQIPAVALETSLCIKGYGIKLDSITDPSFLQHTKEELTAKPYTPKGYRPDSLPPPEFPLFNEEGGYLYVPKAYGLERFGLPKNNKLQEATPIAVEFNGNLRPEQEPPVACFLEAAKDPLRRGGVLNLPCAFGKTALAIYLMCKLSTRTLVIVHKEFLVQQWRERLTQFAPGARIGSIQGDKVDVANKDVVIAMLQSLSMRDYPDEVLSGFGMVIVDEIHRTGAEVFSRALRRVNFHYSLGLSATLQRKDGMSKVFLWHIGAIVFKAKTRGGKEQDDKMTPCVRTIEFESSDPVYCREHYLPSGKHNQARMINNICSYPARTTLIVHEVKSILGKDPKRKILILSDRRAHLTALETELHGEGICDVGYYCGGMKQADLKASEGRKVILGTFQMSQEGLDIRGLDTLVLGSPKTDVVQAVGRILRDKPSERINQPVVLDIVDNVGPFADQAIRRAKFYRSCGYKISNANGVDISEHSDDAPIVDPGQCMFLEV